MPKSPAATASLLTVLAGLLLAACALSPAARAQDTTYTNGQNSGGNLTTSTTITLTADTGVAAMQSGAISGSGSIAKAGNGTLTLSGVSTYTGSTTLLAGTLTFSGGNNRLPGTTTFFLQGGTLNLGTTTQTVANLGSSASPATGTITGGTLLLGSGGTAYLQSGTYTNTFAGSFSRLFIGGDVSATVTLNGTNDGVYSFSHNQVTIGDFGTTGQAGIVKVGNANALAAATENVVVYSGTLDLNGQTAVRGNALVLSGGSLINSDTSHAASFNQSVQLDSAPLLGGEGNLTFGGIVSGGLFLKIGNGTLTFSGVNTYTGDTFLTAGTLAVSGGNNLPATTTVYLIGGGLDLGVTTQTVANVGSAQERATGPITGGTLLLANGGSAYLESGTYSATFANAGASSRLLIGGDASATVTLNGTNNGIFSDHNQVLIGNSTTGAAGIVKLGNANALAAATENVQVYSGTLDLNGQTAVRGNSAQLLGGSAASLINSDTSRAASFTQSVQLTGAPNLGGEGSLTLSGVISGTGSLTKTGGGTLTLSGSNTYSGPTTISGGTLALSDDAQLGTGAAALILGNGTLSTTTGFTSGRAVSLTGSATVNVATGQSTILSGVLSGSGCLTKLGTGTLTLSSDNTYAGNTTISGGTLAISSEAQLGNTAAALILGSGTLSTTTGITSARAITLTGSGAVAVADAQSTTLSGVISGVGSFTKSGNGTLILSGVNTYTGDTTLSAGTLVLSSGNILPATATLLVNGGTLDLGIFSQTVANLGSSTSRATGTITGGTLLLANGGSAYLQSGTYATTFANAGASSRLWIGGDSNATVTLNGTNDGIFSDHNQVIIGYPVTGAAGTVKVGNANALLAATENVQVFTGTLDLNGQTAVRGNSIQLLGGSAANLINSDASHAASFTQSVQLTGAPNLGGEGSLTLSGVISGTGSLTKTGSGTLTLSGSNTYSGPTTVSGGTLALSADAQLGTGVAALSLGNGTLSTTTGFTSGRAVSLTGSATVNVAAGQSTILSGVLSGSGSLTKLGTGTFTLTGSNTYAGYTAIAGGTLAISADNQLGNTGATIFLGNGTLRTTTGLVSGRAINIVGNGTVDVPDAQFTTLSGVISGFNPQALTKTGNGTLTLSGVNTYGGETTLSAGTLVLSGGNNRLPANTTLMLTGGTLDLGTTTQTVTRLGSNSSGATGTITGGTLLLANGGSAFLESGTYATTFANAGASSRLFIGGDFFATVILNGTNDGISSDHDQVLIGTTGIAGIVKVGNANALAAATENVQIYSGTLDLNGQTAVRGGSIQLIGGSTASLINSDPSHAASFNQSLQLTGAPTLGGEGSLTLGGIVSGGSFTKVGNGMLTLTGANAYTGGTTISFGAVRTSHVSALGTGAVTVSGATSILNLSGTAIANTVTVESGGSVQGSGGVGAFTIASGGNVSPGNSPGTLTAGATTFGPGGSYTWQINDASPGGAGATTGWDLLSISGALNVTATSSSPFTLTLASLTSGNLAGSVIDFNPSQNSSYTVATASGGIGGFNANQFVIDATGFSNATNGGTWSLTAVGNDLNLNFTASAIPEPSTYAALAGTFALGLAACRKRRRRQGGSN
jgi:fibronectin-binding autotransporter adhesin